MNLTGRSISKGTASGELLATDTPISFLGGVDPRTGIIIDESHPLAGEKIRLLLKENGIDSVSYKFKEAYGVPPTMVKGKKNGQRIRSVDIGE